MAVRNEGGIRCRWSSDWLSRQQAAHPGDKALEDLRIYGPGERMESYYCFLERLGSLLAGEIDPEEGEDGDL